MKNRHSANETAPYGGILPLVLLCAVPVVATVLFGGVDQWVLGLFAAITAVIGIYWIALAWNSGELRISGDRLQLPVVGLALIAVVQLLPLSTSDAGGETLGVPVAASISMDPYSTRFFLIRLLVYLFFFGAALVFINTRRRVTCVAVMLVIFGGIVAFFAILQRLAGVEGIYGVRPTPQAIPFGSFVNQHHFAALLELFSGVTLGILFGRGVRKDKKPLLIIAALVMGIAIVFTGSRGGMISYAGVVAFAVGVSFLYRHRESCREGSEVDRQKTLLTAVAGAALFLIVLGSAAILGGGEGLTRGLSLSDQTSADITSGRSHFWQVALRIFLDNPVIGAGFDAFGVAFTRYDTWPGKFRVEQAHNDYLQMLADGGILAFACVAVFLYFLFREVSARIAHPGGELRRSIAVGAAAGVFGILIHSFFDFPLRTPANAFFFLLLVALAVVPARDNE